MGLQDLVQPWPWQHYSKKVSRAILSPHSAGSFTQEEADARKMHLAVGEEGSLEEGNRVILYWLVDPDDGVVADARFQLIGQSALIAAAEAACQVVLRMNYDQAGRIGMELLDKQLRDKPSKPAFPPETEGHLTLILTAVQRAANACEGLPLPAAYVAPPAPELRVDGEGGFPGFDKLTPEQQLSVITGVLLEDVVPYVELDGGGVSATAISPEFVVTVAYEGNCTSCFASTGATLGYIQQVLKAKVHEDIQVVPDASTLPTWAG